MSGWEASQTPHLVLWPGSDRVQYTWGGVAGALDGGAHLLFGLSAGGVSLHLGMAGQVEDRGKEAGGRGEPEIWGCH